VGPEEEAVEGEAASEVIINGLVRMSVEGEVNGERYREGK